MANQGRGLIIIANYNQGLEIERFLGDCKNLYPMDQMVVVDDGSTDGSDEMAARMGFHVIRHETNLGIGAAIRTGIQYGLAQERHWVMISSSNGKMVPAEFKNVFGPVARGEADYVQGSRFMDQGRSPGLPSFRKFAIPIFSFFVTLCLRRSFTDATCGMRAYQLQFLKDPRINIFQSWLNRYEMEYYIHYHAVRTAKLNIVEVPVTIRYDHLEVGRQSKIRPVVGWWSMIRPFVLLSCGLKR